MGTASCDCVVIGAGVVGLAVARTLTLRGHEVVVLDCADAVGTGASSRNSETIHAGLYYTPGSLKARLCVHGRDLLYRYCREKGIPYRRCGKLLVAVSRDQEQQLHEIALRAESNGVADVTLLSSVDAMVLEPEVCCTAALLSPSTGIIDSHAFALALEADVEAAGGHSVYNHTVDHIQSGQNCLRLTINDGESEVLTQHVINAAGLNALTLAISAGCYTNRHEPSLCMLKGNYFSLQKKSPFHRLIYPLPDENGLGIHVCFDISGRVRFGPDAEPIREVQYDVSPERAARFYQSVRCYWPGLPDDSLSPAYAGIRAKITVENSVVDDFTIEYPEDHGVGGLTNLLGIDSPGLTAALAIGEHVANRIAR